MQLIDIPAEQTTAATDLVIALLAAAAVLYLKRRGPDGLRGRLWRKVLALLSLGAFLGAVGHGIVLGEQAYILVWSAVYLPLALLVAAFVVATIRDLAGDGIARRALPMLMVAALAFYGYALLNPDDFLPFIVYELVAMMLSLAGFTWITFRRDLSGAGWITAAIAVNILAAAIQAEGSLGFTLVWTFDHNGVFHLVQMLGIGLLVWGLKETRGSHPDLPAQNKTPPSGGA